MKSKQTHELLIVFSRYPAPGTTKTRLSAVLGNAGAAEMQKKLTMLTLLHVRRLRHTRPVAVAICYAGGTREQITQWLGSDFVYRDQGNGDLGQRMQCAFDGAFREGYRRVVVIGTDCPDLCVSHLKQAFESLRCKDLVLGPATDGGYYLIGLRRPEESLFTHMPWGSASVLQKTLNIAQQKNLSIDLLETLRDIDRPEDLNHEKIKAEALRISGITNRECKPSTKKVGGVCSVIIPTRNEAENIAVLLPQLLCIPGLEVLVVDGGSTDDTAAVAETLGATVVHSLPGKAVQMNRGAETAHGDILLFLHADTRLEQGFAEQVRSALHRPGVAAGAFRLTIDGKSIGLRIIERLANFRSLVLQMPYGDQGIFLTRDMFSSVAGFPPLPIMEDFELVRRLRRQGRITILPLHATTSARRWKKLGVLRTALINQAVIAGYLLGVAPKKLAAWYEGK